MRSTLALASFVLAGCLVGDPKAPPASIDPSTVSSGELAGLNVAADGSSADTAAMLGAHWARVELVDGITTPATLDAYHSRGLRVLALADYATLPGYPGTTCAGWNDYRAAWLARLADLAGQLGSRVDAWEIWNEPDQPMLGCGAAGYNPGMPAATYGAVLRDAAATLRGAGATGAIVVGGLDSGQVSYATDALALGAQVDGVAIHPYGVVPDASWCPDPGEDLNCDWGTLGGKVDDYAAATQLPVWITELGVNTTDTQHEADYVTGAYAALATKHVAHAFYFCASDAMVAPYGLTYADGTAKPAAFAAYHAISTAAPPPATHTRRLHGTISAAGAPLAGLAVSAWGQTTGDFHATTTDALGIYAFTDLQAGSLYNIAVNAQFDAGTYDAIDPAHGLDVRNNVALVAGPDGWHGEDFTLDH